MIADAIINRAKRTPYRKGHIHGRDGSLYMERFGLFETDQLSARVHHIARPDHDRALHDHPWNFVSVILRGGYIEARPRSVEPCFSRFDCEAVDFTKRRAGQICYRRATDRHLIHAVDRDTWTLFIYGRAVQWWGFYTPGGKVYWLDYLKANGLA